MGSVTGEVKVFFLCVVWSPIFLTRLGLSGKFMVLLSTNNNRRFRGVGGGGGACAVGVSMIIYAVPFVWIIKV